MEQKHTVVRVHRRTGPFVQIDNDIIRNPQLSLKAKGLLALLLSYDDDWIFRLRHIITLSRDGKESHQTAFKELQKAHHIRIVGERLDNGRFGRTIHIYEIPHRGKNGSDVMTVAGKPRRETRDGKPAHKNINRRISSEVCFSNEKQTTAPAGRPFLKDISLFNGKDKSRQFALRWGAKIQNILKLHATVRKGNGTILNAPVKPTTWARQINYILHKMHVSKTTFLSVMSWYIKQGYQLPPPKAPRIYKVKDLVEKWSALHDSYLRNSAPNGNSGMRHRLGPDGEMGYYDDGMVLE